MKDFEKLLQFADLIGISVVEKSKSKEDEGFLVYDNPPYIEVLNSGKRNNEAMLTLLHELGHAVDWISQGRPKTKEIPTALSKRTSELTSEDRRVLFEYEKNAVKNMKFIYFLLNLKLPLWKLERERRLDLWVATTLLKTGKYPSPGARTKYWNRLTKGLSGSQTNLLLI